MNRGPGGPSRAVGQRQKLRLNARNVPASSHAALVCRPRPCRLPLGGRPGFLAPVRARSDDEEPDWDREMSIFKERTMRPNQLATLRELESKVSVGKLLWHGDGLAIVSGLNSDAPLGTKLAFVSGASGVLLWHRSDTLAFVLVTGGAHLLAAGEGVECKIRGVLQVVDEARGPITKKDYELMAAPAGDALFGSVVDFMGRPLPGYEGGSAEQQQQQQQQQGADQHSSGPQQQHEAAAGQSLDDDDAAAAAAAAGGAFVGFDKTRPLLNAQVAMKCREQITEGLTTGVKALDILTPLGRGASLLVIGPRGSGKSDVGLDAALGQAAGAAGASDVRVVYAAASCGACDDGDASSGDASSSSSSSTGGTSDELAELVASLDRAGARARTAVVAAPRGADLGARLATLLAAAAAGERVRDEGGHALVVLDDVAPLLRAWEALVLALAGLDRELLRQGLIKDEEGRDVSLSPRNEQELVEYEGMLVSGAAAQRRGFFSTLFMRAAKMSRARGGGSMTLLSLVPGRPATGAKRMDAAQYQTLSEGQRARIAAVLAQRAALEAAAAAPGELDTEAVEEFMSISDGQLVLEPRPSPAAPGAPCAPYRANPKLSITRIGSRAYPPALEQLAPQIRLKLAQADDARRFAGLGAPDALVARDDAYARRVAEALLQPPGSPAPLEAQVVTLLALEPGRADAVAPAAAGEWAGKALAWARQVAPKALKEVAATRALADGPRRAILNALDALGSGGAGAGAGAAAGQQQQQ